MGKKTVEAGVSTNSILQIVTLRLSYTVVQKEWKLFQLDFEPISLSWCHKLFEEFVFIGLFVFLFLKRFLAHS